MKNRKNIVAISLTIILILNTIFISIVVFRVINYNPININFIEFGLVLILWFLLFIALKYVLENGSLDFLDTKKDKELKKIEFDKQEEKRKKYEEKDKIYYEKRKARIENEMQELTNQYGKLSQEFILTKDFEKSNKIQISFGHKSYIPALAEKIMIFEENSKIVIRNKTYNFEDIISFELKDNKQIIFENTISKSISETNTKNILGRAIVGGILFGGVGAIIGGSTAKKETNTITEPPKTIENHNFELHIIINNLSDPQIILDLGDNINLANKLVPVMSLILNSNTKLN